MEAARAHLESLLRARKLDVTLTSADGNGAGRDRRAATGWPPLDETLDGGVRRGQLSEIVAPRSSSGGTSLFHAMAAAATARGEVAALVDTYDRFDPVSAAAAGVDLSRLLWVRETGQPERALKALALVLQAGGFGLVALDLTDVQSVVIRRFPHTTWMRLARIVEGTDTVALLMGTEHIARSPGGVTIALDRSGRGAAEWTGGSARTRRLRGLSIRPRVVSARVLESRRGAVSDDDTGAAPARVRACAG
jgi:hypothetical protein